MRSAAPVIVGIEALGTVEEYDPRAERWTRKTDMPTPRLHLSSAVVDGKIVVVGGGPEWPVPSAATEMYDPATDSWTRMADMPTPRVGVWAAALGGEVYVMGGLSWANEALRTVEAFDPKTNSWRQCRMCRRRASSSRRKRLPVRYLRSVAQQPTSPIAYGCRGSLTP